MATGLPPAAISVLRISGSRVNRIIVQTLSLSKLEPRRATLVDIVERSGKKIDTGLAVYMPGPASYTGEDTLEISVHGGRVITELVLNAIMDAGARLANPGEFTRRAFESGKFDLTRAEAVADLIDAESEAQLDQALKQMDGALEKLYSGWRDELIRCLALLEATIDFPDEEDAPEKVDKPVSNTLKKLQNSFDEALSQGNITERIRDGFKLVILGKPNAGKSTLLNRLARRDAAIVTDVPGTTRDVIEVRLVLGGHLIWLSDTAGLRETSDAIEAEGVRRAQRAADEADIRIWVHDISEDFDPTWASREDIVVANKVDIADGVNVSRETLKVSAKSGTGIEELENAIIDRVSRLTEKAGSPMITRARHRQGIERAAEFVQSAQEHLISGLGSEFVAEDVRLASRALGALIGALDAESVLGEVFSSFCIGK